ncbi:MAG: hypothetical protein NT126_07285 [Bacteroidetes bacterium]|nr:hypothetical protein [Bacteroidota bacterium]
MATKKKEKKDDSTKWSVWTFPKNTLEDAIRILKVIEDKNAGNPMHASELRSALGFSPSDWRFQDLLKSANLYGLVSGSGNKSIVKIEKEGQEVLTPSSGGERKEALLKAFRNVDDFRKVEDFYGGKRIPEDEFFYNNLIRNFNIPRDRVDKFSEIFLANINFLKSFNIQFAKEKSETTEDIVLTKEDLETFQLESSVGQRVRKYLDTCFVMMPFGEWFDKYYKEIYIPAIKDASFEPIRADELFTTGSVVEQIWEQINKSKILLAELTGKNANVFYELGLAHAAVKPVIFISSNVDDVPFDLRHLRVIIYDIREPNWADKLKVKITEYLKNALKEPNKSIPHPFRVDNGKLKSE